MTRKRNGSTRAGRTENLRILATNNTCHICGQPGADAIDHVIPLARGGPDTPANKRPAHHNVEPYCNRRKGDRLIPPIIRRSGALR